MIDNMLYQQKSHEMWDFCFYEESLRRDMLRGRVTGG